MQVITDAVGSFLSGKPINREATIGAVQDVFESWSSMGSGYRPDVGARRPRAAWEDYVKHAHRGRAQEQDSEAERAKKARANACAILGLDATMTLTPDLIKEAKRRLAKKHHPDRGGSPERMAAINDAADVLLAEL